jgi:hypothetical protein
VKSKFALILLALLVTGLATQVQADRLQCPTCQSNDTWSHFIHVPCPNGFPPWPQWDEPAWGDENGEPLPQNCPWCGEFVYPEYCRCNNCSTTFWP